MLVNEMDGLSMLAHSSFILQFFWLTIFLTFRKHPVVPYDISQLCDTFVEGFNTTLHLHGLEGCWCTPNWLEMWRIVWKVQVPYGVNHLNI